MSKLRTTLPWSLLIILSIVAGSGLAVASTDPVQNDKAAQTATPVAVSAPVTGQRAAGDQTAPAQPPASTGRTSDSDATAPVTDPAATPATSPKPVDPTASELQEQINELARRLRAAEAKENTMPPAAAPAPAPKPTPGIAEAVGPALVIADKTGFSIGSPDGNFVLKLGADVQLDTRTFLGFGASGLTDNILLRRARPVVSGTIFKYVDYFFRPDFGQGTVVIYDAYVELKYFSHFKVRVGKFKPGVGLERLQSDDDTSFVERGMPTLLVPSRDIGFQVAGDFLNRRANYAVGVFNGVPDNGLSDAAVSDHRDYSARLFLSPFQPDHNVMSGFGIGMGATFGSVDGEALPAFKSFGQNSFMPVASGVTEAGHRTRLAPGLYYYVGPFGLLAEYGLTEEGLQKGTLRREVAFRAWQTEVSYVLTGEKKGFGSPEPKRIFDPSHGGWGAVELAVRVGQFSAERGLYNYGFVASTNAARLAHEVVGGINWYLNPLFRVSMDYARTAFEGGAAATAPTGLNRPTEDALIFRFQIDFVRTSTSWAYRPK